MSQIKLTADSGGGTVALKAPASTTSNSAFELTLPGTGNRGLGKILQVVTVSDSLRESTGSFLFTDSYTDTPFTVDITPTSTNSKILVSGFIMGESDVDSHQINFRVNRAISGGSTTAIQAASSGSRNLGISPPNAGSHFENNESSPFNFGFHGLIDSPSTTSEITYTIQMRKPSTNATFYYNRTVGTTDSSSYERGLSWITVMEVAA